MWNFGAARENKLETIPIYLFQTRQCVCQDQKQEPSANLSVQLKLALTSPCSCPSVLPGMAAWLREMVGEYEDTVTPLRLAVGHILCKACCAPLFLTLIRLTSNVLQSDSASHWRLAGQEYQGYNFHTSHDPMNLLGDVALQYGSNNLPIAIVSQWP